MDAKIDPLGRMEALAKYAELFRNSAFSFGEAGEVVGSGTHDDPIQVPGFKGNDIFSQFHEEMYRWGWVLGKFDYMSWWKGEEGSRFMDDNSEIAGADVDQLSKLMTIMMRGERWSEGWLEEQLANGRLYAIAERASRILADDEPMTGEWQEL